jgi:hypothetical protein
MLTTEHVKTILGNLSATSLAAKGVFLYALGNIIVDFESNLIYNQYYASIHPPQLAMLHGMHPWFYFSR